MSPAELDTYLHGNIPLSAAMHVRTVSISESEVVLAAPLAPNINHRQTLFGGSATAIAILAAWSFLHLRLAETGLPHRLVIQRQTMSYDAPVTGTVTAHGRLAPEADWDRAIELLKRRGKARIEATAELRFGAIVAGRMTGDFVVLRAEAPSGA